MAKNAVSGKVGEKSAQMVAFGGAIYQFRIEKNLSQEELSLRSEVDRSYLSQLERGDKEPCLGTIFRLSKALDSVPSEIFLRAQQLYAAGHRSRKHARVR